MSEPINDFFRRVESLGIVADDGFVRFVCTKLDERLDLSEGSLKGDIRIAGLLMVIGPDVTPLAARSHVTDATIAFQFPLKDIGMGPEEFVRHLTSGVLKTPIGDFVFPTNIDTPWEGTFSAMLDDAAAIREQQRWLALNIDQLTALPQDDQRINWLLRADVEPYDGLVDLMGTFGVNGLGHQAHIVMSVLAAIQNTSYLKEGKAFIQVGLAKGLPSSEFRLGYRIQQRDGTIDRGSIVGADVKWSEPVDLPYQLGEVEIEVPRGAAIQCFAVYAKRAFHYWWIADNNAPLNIRRGLLQLYDDKLAALTETTQRSARRGNSRALEAAIASALWMAGFAPVHLGEWGSNDAPDVVAMTPTGNVIVVECTTGGLRAENKLQKLQDRAVEVREQLDRMGVGFKRVLPAIVTTRPRDEVEMERADFTLRGMLVIAREDIAEALTRTVAPLDGDQIFEEFDLMVRRAKEIELAKRADSKDTSQA